MGGGGPDPKHGVYVRVPTSFTSFSLSPHLNTDLRNSYLGGWGNLGSLTQRGIITYGRSANRQKPLGGAAHAAVFNTFRRSKGQVLYVVPPFVVAYMTMDWAIHRYVLC